MCNSSLVVCVCARILGWVAGFIFFCFKCYENVIKNNNRTTKRCVKGSLF